MTNRYREAARGMNVSEQLVFMAGRLLRTRPDLAARVEAGEITVTAGLRLAEGKPKLTPYERLVRLWNTLDDDDRAVFATEVVHPWARDLPMRRPVDC